MCVILVCTEINDSHKIGSTQCTQMESCVEGHQKTDMNWNKKDERMSVDSILEPTSAVRDLDSFMLYSESDNV